MLPLDLPSTEAELIAYCRSLRDRMRDAAQGPSVRRVSAEDRELARGLEPINSLPPINYRPQAWEGLMDSIAEANRLRLRNED